jgi:hypothetical protein
MDLARRPLMYDAIQKTDVAADGIIERESGGLEVVIAETLIEAATFELAPHMSLDHGQVLIKTYARRQSACGLLHVEEIMAEVIVEISLVQNVIANLPRPIAFAATGAFEKKKPAISTILPGCHFRLPFILCFDASSFRSVQWISDPPLLQVKVAGSGKPPLRVAIKTCEDLFRARPHERIAKRTKCGVTENPCSDVEAQPA